MEKTKTNLILFSLLFILLGFAPTATQAANLYLLPSSGSYAVGDNFKVSIFVSSAIQAMNAASGVISFPQDKLRVVSLSKTSSIASLWVQEPSFSNSAGTVNFEGIVLNPGFTGSAGKIITINFKVKASGSGSLTFSSGSVLANDGEGTNILSNMSGGTYTLKATPIKEVPQDPEYIPPTTSTKAPGAPNIFSRTNPDSDKWYSNNSPEFFWEIPSDVTAIKLLIGKKPNAIPAVLYIPAISEKKLQDLEDGIWYFSARFKNAYGWGEIVHRKVFIDTKVPESFEIIVDNQDDPTNPALILYFQTKDFLSGVERYEIKIGGKHSDTIFLDSIRNNPYKTPLLASGKHNIIVKAFDKAGNFTIAAVDVVIESIEVPVITAFPQTITSGDILTIKGTSSYPESTIIVFIKKQGEEAITNSVKTDNTGDWSYIHPEALEKGIFQVWFQIIDARGAKSNLTDKITIDVQYSAFLKFGKTAIDYLSVIVTLVAFIAVLAGIILYGARKVFRKRKKISKETKEAKESVVGAFSALQEEVKEQVQYLDGKEGLSKTEKQVLKKLKKALNISKRFISKEIKDIEKQLK